MRVRNMPGRKYARRARARGERVQNPDTRFRVGRAHRDVDGQILSTPEGFPKKFHEHLASSFGRRKRRTRS